MGEAGPQTKEANRAYGEEGDLGQTGLESEWLFKGGKSFLALNLTGKFG